ncbi:unnamed protein product [Symbiodinium natans]|uniref:Uncharacterized protein n=1 Tax=Symbiodinium natans TaxID=878477 RepID=A0A812K9G9_9DINO|nr:unnamed protein product [Symbiodinium natans]
MSSKHVSPKLHEERLRKEFVDEKAKEAADRLGLDYETYHDLHKKDTERTWKKVQCGFDLSKAVARFAQMGTLIALSTKDCGAHNFEVNGHQGKTKCTIDVTGAIASAGIASSMITLSVINCPGALDYTRAMSERLCAASIIDLVSAATYIGTSIASVQSTCGSLDNYPGVPGT